MKQYKNMYFLTRSHYFDLPHNLKKLNSAEHRSPTFFDNDHEKVWPAYLFLPELPALGLKVVE